MLTIAAFVETWHLTIMKMLALCLCLPFALATFDPAWGQSPVLRQPIGPWFLNHGGTDCIAYRNYGTPEQPVTFALRPSPNGAIVRLGITRPGRRSSAIHFKLRTNITGGAVQPTGLLFGAREEKTAIVWINLPRRALDGLGRAGEFAVWGENVIDERFALPNIEKVIQGLDACTAELRKHWNIEGGDAKIVTPAEPTREPRTWAQNGDYPAQALAEGASGVVGFVLLVDEAGKVRDCMVEETSGIASLDAMSCVAMIERAQFKPARDASGKAVRSAWTSRFHWGIR